MSSPTPDSIADRAARARNRAQRSRVLGLAALALGFLLVAGFFAQSLFLNPTPAVKPPEPIEPQKTAVISGGASRFSGIDQNSKPFSVEAKDGIQDKQVETLMHLTGVKGSFVRREGGDVIVIADKAQYEIRGKDLKVEGNVRFEEPGRYVAYLNSAEVNLDRQRIVTHDPVRVETPSARVTADSMETSEDGKIVRLKGRVKASFATDIGKHECKEETDAIC